MKRRWSILIGRRWVCMRHRCSRFRRPFGSHAVWAAKCPSCGLPAKRARPADDARLEVVR